MKSIINKLFAGAAIVATLGLGACVNDLDLLPIDPTEQTPADIAKNPKEFIGGLMAKCYSSLAVSGQGGAGSSDISGLDNGTSQYERAIFMMNEFPTDECLWIWPDEGVLDLNTNTFGTSNANIFGTYSRLMVHIAVCNDFLRTVEGGNLSELGVSVDESLQAEINQFKLEARALRALSYYYMIDIFGQCSWAWDDMDYGVAPEQISRVEAYNRVVADLEDVRANWPAQQQVVYGRIGIDAVEALLCKFYLNAEVYTGTAQWQKCWDMAQGIIARHQGGGFQGSGLANNYQALFCGNNDMFAPGGSLADQNEILWVVPQEFQLTESYGATTFLIAAAVTAYTNDPADGYTNCLNYGLNANWKCMHAREQFSSLFGFQNGVSVDKRTLMWATDEMGHQIANTEYSSFTNGYVPIKFNNLLANADGSFPYSQYEVAEGHYMNRFGDPGLNASRYATTNGFADTDYPMIRLADVYLMAAECAMRGVGNRADGVKYANYVRERAGMPAWMPGDLTEKNLIDERGRELYWENVRRTDLIRFNRYTGSNYVWSWKGGVYEGTSTPAYQNLMPIPTQVLAAQASFKQNPGY